MRVRHISKQGLAWDYDTIKEANNHLKKGWRDKAYMVYHPDGDWLEVSDYDGLVVLGRQPPQAARCWTGRV